MLNGLPHSVDVRLPCKFTGGNTPLISFLTRMPPKSNGTHASKTFLRLPFCSKGCAVRAVYVLASYAG